MIDHVMEDVELAVACEVERAKADHGERYASMHEAYGVLSEELYEAEIEFAEQRALQLNKQLEQEKAQTEIDLEIARRANLVAEEEAKVYEQSPEAFELRRLELMSDVIGEGDKIYFIPEGADITLFIGGEKHE